MKAVIFQRPHLMYQRGETAGFADDHADKLIAAGIARDPNAPVPASAFEAPREGKGDEGGDDKSDTPAKGDDKVAKAPDPGAPPVQGKTA